MAMQLDKVIPFGRSLDEYRHMFSLTDADLEKRILSAADGPASANAELNAQGKSMVSIDPLYRFTAGEIESRFDEVVENVMAQMEASPEDWVWTYHRNPQSLKDTRISTMRKFVADFENGKHEKRYLSAELPRLDFPDQHFDLALCSHFLFLYSDLLDFKFHLASILELLRVAAEVRIFPLLSLDLQPSVHLQPVLDELKAEFHEVFIEKVDYEIQKGGNRMLRIINKRY